MILENDDKKLKAVHLDLMKMSQRFFQIHQKHKSYLGKSYLAAYFINIHVLFLPYYCVLYRFCRRF